MQITGKVITGKNKGHIFLSNKAYQNRFERLLGFKPYPGTLNLHIHGQSYQVFLSLQQHSHIFIPSFIVDKKVHGSVDCYLCTINAREKSIFGAVIIPEYSSYKNIIEIVAQKNIRDFLNLDEGDEVTVHIHEENLC